MPFERDVAKINNDITSIKKVLYSHEQRLRAIEKPAAPEKHVASASTPEKQAAEPKEKPEEKKESSSFIKICAIVLVISFICAILFAVVGFEEGQIMAQVGVAISVICMIGYAIFSDKGVTEPEKKEHVREHVHKAAAHQEPVHKERPKDIEALLGGSLLAKIGMFVLVLGVGYFLKYSFDKGWIPPVIRVAMGVIGGLVLIYLGELSEKKEYHIYARTLTGGGSLLLYITAFAANVFYNLIDYYAAIIVSAIITLGVMIFAIKYKSEIIAGFGLVGVFLMPFIMGIDKASDIFMLIYYSIINIGLFILFKKIDFKFIYYLFIVGAYAAPLLVGLDLDILYWFFGYYVLLNSAICILAKDFRKYGLWGVMLGGFILPTAGLVSKNIDFNVYLIFALVVSLTLAVTYYFRSEKTALISFLISIIIGPVFFFSKFSVNMSALYVLLILVAGTFIALTRHKWLMYIILGWALIMPSIMIKVKDYEVTYVWYVLLISTIYMIISLIKKLPALEFVGLLLTVCFVGAFSPPEVGHSILIAVAAYLIFALTSIYRMISSPDNTSIIEVMVSLLNTVFIAGRLYDIFSVPYLIDYRGLLLAGLAILNALIAIMLYNRFQVQSVTELESFSANKRPVIVYAGLALALLAIAVPVQFTKTLTTVTWLTLSVLLVWFAGRLNLSKLRIIGIVLYALSVFKFFFLDWMELSTDVAFTSPRSMIFILIIALTFFMSYILREFKMVLAKIISLVALVFLWGYISYEITQLYESLTMVMTLTLAWAIYAGVLISIGFNMKSKWLRIMALVLFMITLVKLFFYDIWRLEKVYRIIAFVGLGVLLLVVSFLYSKFKAIVAGDDQ